MKEVESDGGASVETAAAIYASMVGSLGIDATPHYMLPRCVAAAAAVCKDMQHPTIDNAKARALVEDPEVGGVPCRMEWMLQGLVVDYWQGEDVHLHRMYFRELAWAGQCCRASWCAMAHCLEVEAAKSAAEAAGAVTLLFADSLLGSQWKCIFQAGTMLSFAGYRLEAWTVWSNVKEVDGDERQQKKQNSVSRRISRRKKRVAKNQSQRLQVLLLHSTDNPIARLTFLRGLRNIQLFYAMDAEMFSGGPLYDIHLFKDEQYPHDYLPLHHWVVFSNKCEWSVYLSCRHARACKIF
jgi:hypothetical protein